MYRVLVSLGAIALLINATSSCTGGSKIQSESADTLAHITKVELIRQETFPVGMMLKIEGELKDTCTRFAHIDQDKKEKLFIIRLVTKDTITGQCPGGKAPFEVEVPLQIQNLPKGTYNVDVNGTRKSFTLEQDNWIEDDY